MTQVGPRLTRVSSRSPVTSADTQPHAGFVDTAYPDLVVAVLPPQCPVPPHHVLRRDKQHSRAGPRDCGRCLRELGVVPDVDAKAPPAVVETGKPSPGVNTRLPAGEERLAVAAQDLSARDDERRVVVPVVASFDDAEDEYLAYCGQPRQDRGEL